MNRLSWMIYLADVCSNIGFPAGVFSILGVIAGVVSTIIKAISKAGESEDDKIAYAVSTSIQRCAMPVAIISIALSILAPSKDTVYAIAASEMGEEVLKSPEVSKARQALSAWLDKQIGEPKKEQTK